MTRKLSKKLTLGKKAIAHLSKNAMSKIDGGSGYTNPTFYCGVSGTGAGSVGCVGDTGGPPPFTVHC